MATFVQLDISTLLFGVSVTMLLAAVLLGTFWTRYRSEIHGIGTWTTATVLIGVGSMLFLFQGSWPGMVTMCGANLLVHTGINLVGVGICQFEDRRIGVAGWGSGLILLATTSVFVSSAALGAPGTGGRIIASTICIGAALVFIATSISPSSRRTVSGYLLLSVSAFVLLMSVVRIVYTTQTLDTLPDLMMVVTNPVQGVFVLGYFVLGMVIIFALILFVPSRLYKQQRALANRIDMLYREMSHRVGNNLNVILNYLDMAQDRTQDDGNRAVLAQSQNMVAAISAVHGAMNQQREGTAGLPLHEHLAAFSRQCVDGFRRNNIQLELDLQPVCTDSRTLKNVILIVNELITNACKYAFNATSFGVLYIGLKTGEEVGSDAPGGMGLRVEVADTGSGLPHAWGEGPPEGTGFGHALVEHCVADLDGELAVDTGPDGTRITVWCPKAPVAREMKDDDTCPSAMA